MRKLSTKLKEFIADAPVKVHHRELTTEEKRLFRSLKTQGERATKGRQISECLFESRSYGRLKLMMVMECRHSMSVGTQIVNRFGMIDEVERAKLLRTKTGSKYVHSCSDM